MTGVTAGNLVLVQHPWFSNQPCVARVVSTTAKMFYLQYWDTRSEDFGEKSNHRSQVALIRVLHPEEVNVERHEIKRFVERLASMKAEREHRIKKANESYNRDLERLEIR